jgi:protocatechuate 3,4-dioxygenase beta subunit
MKDSEKQFEDFVRQINFDDTPDYSHRDKLEQDLLAVLTKPSRQQKQPIKIWSTITKSPIAKLAAAAAIVMAVLIGISTFNGTTTWARVIKALGEVENIYVVSTITMPDGTRVQSKRWLRKPHCLREEEPSRTVIDNGKERLTINKEKKRAQFEDSWAEFRPISQDYIFEQISIFRGQKVEGVTVKKLEEKSNDNIIVFHLDYSRPYSQHTFQGKAWVHTDTMLPKKIVVQLTSKPEAGDPQSGEMIFEYAPISDDVFETVVPVGYTIRPRKKVGVISGKVIDEQGGAVSDALVFIASRGGHFVSESRTDVQGNFAVKLPPPHTGRAPGSPVFLRAYQEGQSDKVAWTIIPTPDNAEKLGGSIPGKVGYVEAAVYLFTASGIVLQMEPAGKISGQINDVDGKPITNVSVTVKCNPVDNYGNELHGYIFQELGGRGKRGKPVTQTDKNGRYEFTNLPRFWDKTLFILNAAADGYVDKEIRFRSAGPMDYKEVDFQLYRAGLTVSGVVVNNYGEPLSERQIYARVSGEDYRACRTKTDERGRFRLVGCPATPDLQIKAELSHNHWPPHEKERYMSYRYHPDVIVGIDYEAGKMEYEVELVAERPDITIEVELENTDGKSLPYFPVEVRGAPGSISSQWRADKKLNQRTDERGYCRFTEVPDVESLHLVMWGGDDVWNETLSKEQVEKIKKKYKKYKWTEMPIELIPGRKEYKIEVTVLTNEEYEQRK